MLRWRSQGAKSTAHFLIEKLKTLEGEQKRKETLAPTHLLRIGVHARRHHERVGRRGRKLVVHHPGEDIARQGRERLDAPATLPALGRRFPLLLTPQQLVGHRLWGGRKVRSWPKKLTQSATQPSAGETVALKRHEVASVNRKKLMPHIFAVTPGVLTFCSMARRASMSVTSVRRVSRNASTLLSGSRLSSSGDRAPATSVNIFAYRWIRTAGTEPEQLDSNYDPCKTSS
jgi:hypothetical protein